MSVVLQCYGLRNFPARSHFGNFGADCMTFGNSSIRLNTKDYTPSTETMKVLLFLTVVAVALGDDDVVSCNTNGSLKETNFNKETSDRGQNKKETQAYSTSHLPHTFVSTLNIAGGRGPGRQRVPLRLAPRRRPDLRLAGRQQLLLEPRPRLEGHQHRDQGGERLRHRRDRTPRAAVGLDRRPTQGTRLRVAFRSPFRGSELVSHRREEATATGQPRARGRELRGRPQRLLRRRRQVARHRLPPREVHHLRARRLRARAEARGGVPWRAVGRSAGRNLCRRTLGFWRGMSVFIPIYVRIRIKENDLCACFYHD
nr:uncharacterized protein LOC113806273 [Penaeus vannamei]